MKQKLLILPLVVAAAATVAVLAFGGASAQAPGPSAGTVLVDGLLQPRGIEIGPDSALYVAEAGTGGDTEITVGEGDEAFTIKTGLTGRISRIDTETGERETVADGLPSGAGGPGGEDEAVGPADVAFIGTTLYYLQTHGGEEWGFPDNPTGIYRINSAGDAILIADIGEFNRENPVESITSGVQVDVEPGGNPYSMDVRNGVFWVVDGNHNRLLRVTTGGDIEEVTEFPNHPVSTGIDFASDGTAWVAYLGQGPFPPDQGKVVTVDVTDGTITERASGVSMLTDVEFGPGGQLYALSFNDTTAGEFPAFGPFTGSIQKVNSDGTLSLLVSGLSFATFLAFDDDAAFVSNFSVTPDGQIIKIDDFSSVDPPPATPTPAATTPAAAPTATPRGGVIGAPDTGDGSALTGDEGWAWPLVILGMMGAALALIGTRFIWKRD